MRGLPVSFQGQGRAVRSPSNPNILYAAWANSTQLIFANDSIPPGATATGGADGSTLSGEHALQVPLYRHLLTGPRSAAAQRLDGGDSWRRATPSRIPTTPGQVRRSPGGASLDPDQLYLGYIGPNRSFDGGKTIEDMVVWKENRLLAQSVYDQADDKLIFVRTCTPSGTPPAIPKSFISPPTRSVYRSADGGRTNVRVNQGNNTLQFYRGVSMSQQPGEKS